MSICEKTVDHWIEIERAIRDELRKKDAVALLNMMGKRVNKLAKLIGEKEAAE